MTADITNQTNENPLYDAAIGAGVTSHEHDNPRARHENEYDIACDVATVPPADDTYAQVPHADPQGGDVYATVQKSLGGKSNVL